MESSIIYAWAAFSLPRGLIALCALKGGHKRIGRSLVRRWTCLMVGTADDQLRNACTLAAQLQEGRLTVQGKPDWTAEKLIAKMRVLCQEAVPLGHDYPSPHKPRVSGFLFEIEHDRKAQWKLEFSSQAQEFGRHLPVQRCIQNKMLYQKVFSANEAGFADWQRLRLDAPAYVHATVLIHGAGEV